jgi:hypothetical protein
MDTEQEVENHSAPVSDYADPLYGIRGWLLVYLIGPVGLNLLWLIMSMGTFIDQGLIAFGVAFLLLIAIALFSLFAEKPWVRVYHICFNLIFAALLLTQLSPFAAFMAVWAVYWFVSKRVRRTYCSGATVASSD